MTNETIITSVSNPAAKAARALKTRKARKEAGLHLAEGPKTLAEIIESGIAIHTLFCEAGFAKSNPGLLERAAVKPVLVSEQVLEALSDTRAPQGVVMSVVTPDTAWDDEALAPGITLALDAIQDPGNLGAIIRAADALGADRVLLGEGCAEPFSPKAVRACAGSCYHLPVLQTASLCGSLRALKRAGAALLAADVHGEERFPALSGDVCVVMGNEGNGLRAEIAGLCQCVRLEMRGRAESLNVALAAGIFLYELERREYERN